MNSFAITHICKAVRILAKGYLPISLVTPLKLKEIYFRFG